MARRRRSYTSEFKAEAVKLVTEQGYSVAEACRSLVLPTIIPVTVMRETGGEIGRPQMRSGRKRIAILQLGDAVEAYFGERGLAG